MTNDRQSQADVRDLLADLVARCRTRWAAWASVSPQEWPLPVRWSLGAAVLLGALTLSWSMWWLIGLPVRTSLSNDIAAGRTALDLATSQAKQLPQLMTTLRNAEAETVAWERLLPVAASDALPGAPMGIASAAAVDRLPGDRRQPRQRQVPRGGSTIAYAGSDRMWRADLESLVARAGLVLEMARPGTFDAKAGIDTERAEMRVTGPVAGLIGLLAEIERSPRQLVIERLNLQAVDASAAHDANGQATLKVTIAAYVWHRESAAGAVSDAVPMPKLPETLTPWQMPTAMVDVFRASLTGRPGQATAAMVLDPAVPAVSAVDVADPIGEMQAGARRVTFRRVANGVTSDWAGPAHPPAPHLETQINVTLHGVETVDALKAFARLTGRNLVLGERVAGRLDVEMANVSQATAFEVLIRAAGLGVRSLHGVDWVAPKAELLADEQAQLETAAKRETMQPLVSRRFTLNYPRALELREVIIGEKDRKTQRLLSSRGSLIADPRTNQLFVTDLPERLDALGAFIARIDVPVRQVLIEARIVEADDRFSESLGVNLAGYYARTHAQKAGNAAPSRGGETTSRRSGSAAGNESKGMQGTRGAKGGGSPAGTGSPGLVDILDSALPAAALAGVAPPSLAITLFGRSATRFLQLELSALETSGRGRVVSRPRVVTADKVEAVIEQGTELPYQARSGRRSVSTVQFRKATLRLEVTPLITPDGQVILDVDVRKDSVGHEVADGFAVDTRHVKTQVQVEDGGTVAIGGIYQEERRGSRAQVPWLGDVPLLGALFRNRSEEDRRTELLVFITPSVVPEVGGVDANVAPGRPAPLRGGSEEMPGRKAFRGALDQPASLPEVPANDVPAGHARLTAASLEATRSARPTHIPVSSGIGTQISAIHAGKRNTCRIDGGGQDHGRTRRRATSRTAVL